MSWTVIYSNLAIEDLNKFSDYQVACIKKIIDRVAINPLPKNEGGYGKPLGNIRGVDLSNCFKIKLKKAGIRVVYQLVRTETQMYIIVIGARRDDEVYDETLKRLIKN